MDMRDVILAAADHIERNPQLYQFSRIDTGDGDCPVCMWGRIGRLLGLRNWTGNIEVASRVQGVKHGSTRKLYGILGPLAELNDPKVAAQALRTYADKYHPGSGAPALDPAFLAFRDKFSEAFEAA